MKDINGNEVNTGDILLYRRSSCCASIWQKPSRNDGHGYYYCIDGKKYIFAWAWVEESIKIHPEEMPEGFLYSFKHGMSDINSPIIEGTASEILSRSDWKDREIKKEQVDRYNFMKTLKIKSIEDIKSNIEDLKNPGYLPHEIVDAIFKVADMNKTNLDFGNWKGEIGIAHVHDLFKYHCIIDIIDKSNPKKLQLK